MGTENAILAYVQPFLRRKNADSRSGMGSFCYGKSVSNQVSNVSACIMYSNLVLAMCLLVM